MSEPVIKAAVHACLRCSDATVAEPHAHAFFQHPEPQPLYTRDDLVRVAEATAAAAGYHGARAKAHATRVVDRLTKGET